MEDNTASKYSTTISDNSYNSSDENYENETNRDLNRIF